MSDTQTTLHNSRATDKQFSSSVTLAGGERCAERESRMEASVPGALTLKMVEASIERMRNRPSPPPPTYDQRLAEQVMRAVKRRMGL